MKKNEQGKWIFKDNFFMRYLWRGNSFLFVLESALRDGFSPNYPKNLCSLFWGTVCAPIVWIFSFFLMFPFMMAVLFVLHAIFFIFGFLPILNRKEYHDKKHMENEMLVVHPYKKYGKNDEKTIKVVPWQILLPIFLVWKIVDNSFAMPRIIFNSVWAAILLPVVWVIVGLIVVIAALVIFSKSTVWKVAREFLKAKKQKVCPLIEFEKK